MSEIRLQRNDKVKARSQLNSVLRKISPDTTTISVFTPKKKKKKQVSGLAKRKISHLILLNT